MTTEPKFCKDCKHFQPSFGVAGFSISPGCNHPSNMGAPDLVSGIAYPMALPASLRMANANCGKEGLMFEAKPPGPEPAPKPAFIVYEPPDEIRKPGWGHPIMLMAYAVVALFVGLLAWAIFG